MNRKKKMVSAAITAVISLGLTTLTTVQAKNDNKNMEKCAGIVKAKMNDCGAPTHSCAGLAKKDSDPSEWIYMPKGTCQKIVGGIVIDSTSKEMKKDVKDMNVHNSQKAKGKTEKAES